MYGLTTSEKALAWDADWEISSSGIMLVTQDMKVWKANPACYRLLNVTPAQLLGQSLNDITPLEIGKINTKNAHLVMDGNQDGYTLPMVLDFGGGHTVRLILTAKRVPPVGSFRFLVCELVKPFESPIVSPQYPDLFEWVSKHYKWLIGFGTIVGSGIVVILKFILEAKK